jgi:hypothetical protein
MFHTLDNMPYDLMLPESVAILQSGCHYDLKSDVARWEILRIYGGIYVDTDMECKAPFEPFRDTDSFVAYGWHTNTVGNALQGFVPGHRIPLECSKMILRSCFYEWKKVNSRIVWQYTVDGIQSITKDCTIIYPKETFYPFSWYAVLNNLPEIHKDYPDSAAVHWWTGILPDGWCSDRDKMAGGGENIPCPISKLTF